MKMINLEKLFIAAALLCTPLIASNAQAEHARPLGVSSGTNVITCMPGLVFRCNSSWMFLCETLIERMCGAHPSRFLRRMGFHRDSRIHTLDPSTFFAISVRPPSAFDHCSRASVLPAGCCGP